MSSIGAGGAENFSTVLLNLVLGKTMKWKSLGEEYIRNSGIKYTIVRPGGLVGDSGQLGIKFAQGDNIIGFIPRADVASVLVESAFNEHSYDKTFEVINDESLVVDAWRNEFVNLNKEEFGQIATGNFPLSYTFSILLILVLIIYFIRRRKSR
jgi:nucleoside-diphosphate-sugar epimerase